MSDVPVPAMAEPQFPFSTASIPASSSDADSAWNLDTQSQVDCILRILSSIPVGDDFTTFSFSLRTSLERLLDSSDDNQSILIDKTINLGSLLLEAGNRSIRRRSSIQNTSVWPLPRDLTIKVFSMLDSRSLCFAAATCSLFHKCSTDPFCYTHVDLTSKCPKVDNAVVATMVQRAGNALRSLKLGTLSSPKPLASYLVPVYGLKYRHKKEQYTLTSSCLRPLSNDNGFAGMRLRRLSLYNIDTVDYESIDGALAVCSSLIDFEVVGLRVELSYILLRVSKYCPLIERLFFQCSNIGRDETIQSLNCTDLTNNCPNVVALTLKGYWLNENSIRTLVKGFRNLKHINLSTSYNFSGGFLRGLGGNAGGNLLEVLILRDCRHLKGMEIARMLAAVISGDFKHLRYIDFSNKDGLPSNYVCYHKSYSLSVILLKVVKARPHLRLLADVPVEESSTEFEQMLDQDYSDESWHSQSNASDGSMLMSTSESGSDEDEDMAM